MTEEDLDDVMLIENESFFEPYQRSFFKKAMYKNNVFLLVAEREIESDEKELRELCQTRKLLRQYQYYDSDDMDIDDTCQQQHSLNAPVTHVIAGYVSYWIKHGAVTVVSIAVASHSRGRGVGSKLMRHVVAWTELSGIPRVSLELKLDLHWTCTLIVLLLVYMSVKFKLVADPLTAVFFCRYICTCPYSTKEHNNCTKNSDLSRHNI